MKLNLFFSRNRKTANRRLSDREWQKLRAEFRKKQEAEIAALQEEIAALKRALAPASGVPSPTGRGAGVRRSRLRRLAAWWALRRRERHLQLRPFRKGQFA